jgi:Ca-activated chloride channel family protein
MLRRTFRVLPLILAPLFFVGCADERRAEPSSAPSDGEAKEEKQNRALDSESDSLSEGNAQEPAAAPTAVPEAEMDDRYLDPSPAASASPPMTRPAPRAGAPSPKPSRPREQGYAKPQPLPFTPKGLDGGGRTDEKREARKAKPKRLGKLDQGRKKPEAPKARNKVLVDAHIPRNMYFRHYGVNPTIDTAEAPKSTFAVDVDTASYTMTRSFLDRGNMPNEAAVRVEELVNAFDYGYQAPTNGKVFNVHAEAAPSPNRPGYHVLHVGIKGKTVSKAARKNANLVFVVDVSGSMDSDNRLGLVKKSLRLLVNQLGEADKVGIVTYGSDAKEMLQPTSVYNKAKILSVVDRLSTEGATNAEAGLRVGYKMASKHFRAGAVNRVILCSDGVANVGITGPGGILSTVQQQVQKGITMTTIGVGMGNYNDVLMEQLANKGNGNYFYVDKLGEARRVFVKQLTGTLQTIAKDVKIQLDFDRQAIARYRLIGYENRGLTAKQFKNDAVDAGEVGAGHSVTAIYEVKLRPGARSLGKVRIRYKQPSGSVSQLIEQPIVRSIIRSSTDALSSPTQLSLVAAQFGEKLRGSYWARNINYEDILARFNRIQAPLRQRADVVELRGLVKKAELLDKRGDKFDNTAGPIAQMGFDRVPVLR